MSLTNEDLRRYEEYMKFSDPNRYEGKCAEFENEKIVWKEKKEVRIECEDVKIEIITVKEIKKPVGRPRKHNKKKRSELTTRYKELRPLVLERDNYMCTSCHTINDVTVHHIIHRKHGGKDEMNNLTTLCEYCHYKMHKNEPIGNLMRKSLVRKGRLKV